MASRCSNDKPTEWSRWERGEMLQSLPLSHLHAPGPNPAAQVGSAMVGSSCPSACGGAWKADIGDSDVPTGLEHPPFSPPNPPTAIWDGRDLGSAGAVLQHHRPGSADPAGTALDTGIAPKDGNVFPKCCSDLGRGQGRRIACQISSRHVNAAGSK